MSANKRLAVVLPATLLPEHPGPVFGNAMLTLPNGPELAAWHPLAVGA